ncbi:MAG: hypothetical protein HYU66_15475, partial [Armatimonadetes bacterium]|nr:hypothetical protein [Armatimonadota bacterium]
AARVLGEALADPAVAPAAAAALGRIPGKDANAALLRGLTTADPAARPAVAALLGERRVREAVGPLRDLAAQGAPAERAAALRALAAFTDAKLLPALQAGTADPDAAVQRAARQGLLRLADALRERDAKAAAGLYRQVWEQGGRGERGAALVGLAAASQAEAAPLVMTALADPQLRATASGVLLALGGPEAKAAVEAALAHPTAEDELLFFRWLVRHDAEGAPVFLLPAARGATDPVVRVAALDLLPGEPRHETIFLSAMGAEDAAVREAGAHGLVRLAEAHLGAGRKTAALALFHRVLGANVGGRPIRRALEGVTALADAGSLEQVKSLLARGVARDEAAEALYAIAQRMLPGDKAAAMALLEQVARLQPPVDKRQAALVQLKGLGVNIDLAHEDGFVTRWWIVGALPVIGDAVYGKSIFPDGKPDPARPVDFEGKHYAWGKHHETKSALGVVELLEFFPNATNVVAYALTEVSCEQERQVVFRVGSDDGYELWVNGERLGGFAGGRMLKVDEESLPGKLVKGRNTILLKILNGGSRWAYVLRITDGDGRPVAFKQQEE